MNTELTILSLNSALFSARYYGRKQESEERPTSSIVTHSGSWGGAYLFHEGLSQADHLGEEDGVVGQVGAQVAQHAEGVLPQVLEALGRPGGPAAPQWPQHTALRPLGNSGPGGFKSQH